MAHISSKDIGVFMSGGYNLLGFSTMVGLGIEVGTEEAYVLGDDWVYFETTGIYNASLTQNGFYTTETAGSNEAFATMRDNNVAVPTIVGMGGGVTLNSHMWMLHAPLVAGFDISAAKGELVKANGTYTGAGEAHVGRLIGYSAGTGKTTFTGAAVNNSVATADGCFAILEVPTFVLDGATKAVFKLQGSVNGTSGWTDIITFPDVLAAHAFALAEYTTGTVHQYLRVTMTWTGTPGDNANAMFAVAVYRKPAP